MSKYFWIIFVLMGLWQFIGSIAERATKKQQDQRVSDLTAQRRRQMATGRTAASRTARPQTGPVVVDRAGDLATRRKAQLDELRRRRGTQTRQPAALTRPTPATLRTTQPPTRTVTPPPVAIPQRTAAPVRRQAQQARRSAPPRERAVRPVKQPTVLPGRVLATSRSVEARGARELRLPGLVDVPIDRALLRRMMLYREILEPPIALREVQSWER